MSKQTNSSINFANTPAGRTAVALIVPLVTAVLISAITLNPNNQQANVSTFFAGLGIASWFLGLRWFGLPGMGLRGKRPLYSSIGFAVLGWTAFLLFRFIFVRIVGFGPAGSTRSFIFLLLFEAFALQLWTFGLLFRAMADWRGPIAAVIGSGVIFGGIGYLLFQESFFGDHLAGLLYFVLWGVFYGVIRLRTGSILGTITVQALHSFTAWVVMVPQSPPEINEVQQLYLAAGVAYLIFIWRLWPKEEADYRV